MLLFNIYKAVDYKFFNYHKYLHANNIKGKDF
jgi:hypothetical protein